MAKCFREGLVPFAPKNGLFYANFAVMFKFGSNMENFDQK